MLRSFALAALVLCFASLASAVAIPTVRVGNAGNAADFGGYGSVSYEYRIATYEVTNAQYAEFLNAKAKSDPLELYRESMTINGRGGINRLGTDGNYSYAAKANMENKPVNYVTWYDAIRFANWMHNGQGNGDTETGAYTILEASANPANGLSITRNAGAVWFLPSEDEWYKAAFHQPASQGGDVDDYWVYTTASNFPPTPATANSFGDISNPGAKVANYDLSADWNGQDGNVTTVGSAGPLSNSFYGTADQGGNVWEWSETLARESYRVFRGNSFEYDWYNMRSDRRGESHPIYEIDGLGFRLATVPEPSNFLLGAFALLGLFAFRKRNR